MGCCGHSDPVAAEEMQERNNSKKIDKITGTDQDAESKFTKLLLLGTGESGKSTLFKQLITIHGKGFSDYERRVYLPRAHQNCIWCAQVLIKESELLPEEFNTRLSSEFDEAKRIIGESEPGFSCMITPALAAAIKTIWATEQIQNTWKMKDRYQIPECGEYFLSRIDTIAKHEYLPTDQDIYRIRIPTTGIVTTEFAIGEKHYKMVDVGGQRNERKKWIHCFEDVTAMIFVVAMNEYDNYLMEDATTNRMNEALNLFDEMCNSPWFQKTSIVLFLNKCDLFAEKIKRSDLKELFPEYTGGSDYTKGADYIKKKFINRNKNKTKTIYPFITNATDTTVVRSVFVSVNDIILNLALADGGLK